MPHYRLKIPANLIAKGYPLHLLIVAYQMVHEIKNKNSNSVAFERNQRFLRLAPASGGKINPKDYVDTFYNAVAAQQQAYNIGVSRLMPFIKKVMEENKVDNLKAALSCFDLNNEKEWPGIIDIRIENDQKIYYFIPNPKALPDFTPTKDKEIEEVSQPKPWFRLLFSMTTLLLSLVTLGIEVFYARIRHPKTKQTFDQIEPFLIGVLCLSTAKIIHDISNKPKSFTPQFHTSKEPIIGKGQELCSPPAQETSSSPKA